LKDSILIASGFPEEAISVKIQTLRSGVARDILNESHQNYDILVVGRTGISKIEDITLGSVASKLVDVVAHLPIIVVGENTRSKKIIIAIDAPVKRKTAAVKEELESNPKLTNQDCYRKGYRFKIKPDDMAELNNLLNSKIFKGTFAKFRKEVSKIFYIIFHN